MFNRSDHQLRIEQFMIAARQSVRFSPTIPPAHERLLRARLILEEAMETIEALGVTIEHDRCGNERFEVDNADAKASLVGIADGCADLSVVTIGTLSSCGIADESLLKLVDENNLKKFAVGHSWSENGKLIKPPGHKPPDIACLLQLQTESAQNYERGE